jgi:membrane protein YqaA with SNARE-associated domain
LALASYIGLFALSFLAATVLPFASEASLATVVYTQRQLILPIIVATAGNYLGACTTYWIGSRVTRRIGRNRELTPTQKRAVDMLGRYGQPVLVLSWVPLIGDALVVAAGAMEVSFGAFSFWIILGKVLRYLAVAWAAYALIG